jgi:hypothetical protein
MKAKRLSKKYNKLQRYKTYRSGRVFSIDLVKTKHSRENKYRFLLYIKANFHYLNIGMH